MGRNRIEALAERDQYNVHEVALKVNEVVEVLDGGLGLEAGDRQRLAEAERKLAEDRALLEGITATAVPLKEMVGSVEIRIPRAAWDALLEGSEDGATLGEC